MVLCFPICVTHWSRNLSTKGVLSLVGIPSDQVQKFMFPFLTNIGSKSIKFVPYGEEFQRGHQKYHTQLKASCYPVVLLPIHGREAEKNSHTSTVKDPHHLKEIRLPLHRRTRDKNIRQFTGIPIPSSIIIGQIEQPGLKPQSKGNKEMNNCELLIPSITGI